MPDEEIDFSQIPDAEGSQYDLTSIPDADMQNSRSEAKKILSDAWRTCEDIGNVYPLAEAAAHITSSLYSVPISGLGGLLSMPFVGVDGAQDVMDTMNKWMVYQPQTERGTRLSESALYPLAKLEQGASKVGDEVMKRTGDPYLSTAVYTAIAGAPALIGLKSLPKAVIGKMKSSTSWRTMTIKERGVVVQGLEETIRKNPKMTEGDIIRKYDGLKAEGIARRAKSEKIVMPKIEKKPPVVSKAKKVSIEEAEKFNREVSEIVRKETDLTPDEINSVFLMLFLNNLILICKIAKKML
jgi:hypothetical protein